MRAIDAHPQRDFIIDSLLRGDQYGSILAAIEPKVSSKALQRYRAGPLRAALEKAAQQRAARQRRQLDLAKPADRLSIQKAVDTQGDPFLTRIVARTSRREGWMRKAEDAENFQALASLDRNELGDLQFEAQLVGRLNEAHGPQTAIVLVLPPAERPAQQQDADVIDVEPCG